MLLGQGRKTRMDTVMDTGIMGFCGTACNQ